MSSSVVLNRSEVSGLRGSSSCPGSHSPISAHLPSRTGGFVVAPDPALPMIRHTDVLSVAGCQECQRQIVLLQTSSLTAKEPLSSWRVPNGLELEGTFMRLQVLDKVAEALSADGRRRSASHVKRTYDLLLGLSVTSRSSYFSTKPLPRFGRRD